jgi:hypothetical protein
VGLKVESYQFLYQAFTEDKYFKLDKASHC